MKKSKKAIAITAFIIILSLIAFIILKVIDSSDNSYKNEIFKTVKLNHRILEKVPAEIKKLPYGSDYSAVISTSDKTPLDNLFFPEGKTIENINGMYLYILGPDDAVAASLDNDIFLKTLKIKSILEIQRNFASDRFNVFFMCGYNSTTIYGFYYTENNMPIGFNGADVSFKQSGKGYSWQDKEENPLESYYTEKITDNWFYYEDTINN